MALEDSDSSDEEEGESDGNIEPTAVDAQDVVIDGSTGARGPVAESSSGVLGRDGDQVQHQAAFGIPVPSEKAAGKLLSMDWAQTCAPRLYILFACPLCLGHLTDSAEACLPAPARVLCSTRECGHHSCLYCRRGNYPIILQVPGHRAAQPNRDGTHHVGFLDSARDNISFPNCTRPLARKGLRVTSLVPAGAICHITLPPACTCAINMLHARHAGGPWQSAVKQSNLPNRY